MIVFSNPGLLDLRALKTFGLTSKGAQNDKIGRFGTGLKYGIATILRAGGKVTIRTGGNEHVLSTQTEVFRGEEHTHVTLDGEPLPFTTALGRDWEAWMAFRELYANALDEGGSVEHVMSVEGCDADTLICVEWAAFEAIFFTIEEHFITEETPLWAGDGLEVYQGRSQFVFYRGVAVHKLKEPAAYRYNITSYMDLTEDRTAKYSFQIEWRLAEACKRCDNAEVVSTMTDARNKFEASIDYADADGEPSEVFLGAAAKNGGNCSPSARKVIMTHIPDDDGDSYTCFSQGEPGGRELHNAILLVRSLGADVSDVKWVLAGDIPMTGNFEVKGKIVFLSSKLYGDAEAMNKAVFDALNIVRDGRWAINLLLSIAEERLDEAERADA